MQTKKTPHAAPMMIYHHIQYSDRYIFQYLAIFSKVHIIINNKTQLKSNGKTTGRFNWNMNVSMELKYENMS